MQHHTNAHVQHFGAQAHFCNVHLHNAYTPNVTYLIPHTFLIQTEHLLIRDLKLPLLSV